MITFKDVSFSYDKTPILNNVSFSVRKGEFVFLIGKSGVGKSTLLNFLIANRAPTNGQLSILDYEIPGISKKEIPDLRKKIGVVFQDAKLLNDRNVYDNLSFVLRVLGTRKKYIKKKIIHTLTDVGLSDKNNFFPRKLSGGEKQRAAIARAVINDPPIILADEPSGNLDPETTGEIFDILLKFNKRGTTIICATHNYSLVKNYKGRALKLEGGQIIELAQPEIDELIS